MSMMFRSSSVLLLVAALGTALGCSAGSSGPSTVLGNGSGGGGTNTGSGGSGNDLNLNGNSNTTHDPNDTRDVPVRQKSCDANNVCTCLRLAMLGTLASSAADPDSQAFVDWLNAKSGGTATLTHVSTKPNLDSAFLAQYDILLVANINSWSISGDEKAAVQKWVESGGGLINLTGFSSSPTESETSSQLIAFSGVKYSGTEMSQWTAPASGEKEPVYYKGGSVNLKQCLYRTGTASAEHSSPYITTPIKFTPQTGSLEKLTLGLDYVGAFIGWPVTAPQNATVVAQDPVTKGNMAVAMEVNGKGRIFAFGDEWVIFTNEWLPVGNPSNMQMDQGNMCWVPASGTTAGLFHSVQTLYQTKQFWYDAINWVAPPNECNFVVQDPDVVIR